MPIRVACHSCGRQLNAPDQLAGRKAKCPSCGTVLPIPAAEPIDVVPSLPKERQLPKRRQPQPEERITTEADANDEPEEVVELGGDCSGENDDDDGPIVTVTLAGTRATDADVTRLKSFPKLRTLDLSATQITDAGLVHLKPLTQLQTLNLKGTKVTNTGVAALQAALPRVRIVH